MNRPSRLPLLAKYFDQDIACIRSPFMKLECIEACHAKTRLNIFVVVLPKEGLNGTSTAFSLLDRVPGILKNVRRRGLILPDMLSCEGKSRKCPVNRCPAKSLLFARHVYSEISDENSKCLGKHWRFVGHFDW